MAVARDALESPALGTGLAALVHPCGDPLRPAVPKSPATGPPIGVTFSGGGFRATFAALGVARFLADCGQLANLRYSSSVSGGSVANEVLSVQWPNVREDGYTSAILNNAVIGPLAARVAKSSLKRKLIRNVWRSVGPSTPIDVLAMCFDDWFFDGTTLDRLDSECRWIFNASNLTTGVRFAFERDVLGDYVSGLVPTAGTNVRVAQAVAASAAVPGAFAPLRLGGITFPCGGSLPPKLLDGGADDNTGLEALDGDSYDHVFTISLNAGGVFVTGSYGRFPLVRELARANSLLYRQSTSLRTRWMVDRFQAWERTPDDEEPPRSSRRGALFGLGTSIERDGANPDFRDFAAEFPEHRTFKGKDLAFVPTVFDKLETDLLNRLVYRGWWLTGAALARWQPGFARLLPGARPPPIE